MTSINIFILHYQDELKTYRCLEAFQRQAHIYAQNTRTFIIDNGSPQPFKLESRDGLHFRDVEVIRYEQNLFLIEAFNRAIRANKAAFYICAANDVVPYAGLINGLISTLIQKDVGVASAGTNDLGAGWLYVGDKPDPTGKVIDVPHVDNSLWAFSHRLVKEIGLPDCEGHTHQQCWASNQDYCYRARMAGFRVCACKHVFYWHEHMGGMNLEAWQAGRDWLRYKWGEKAGEVGA